MKVARIERVVFPGDAWSVSDFVDLFRETRSAALVAEAESQVVGYVVGQAVDGEGYIVTIAVHPDHQGKELGRALFVQMIGWLIEQGAASLRLHVSTSNITAIQLYKSEGFRIVGKIPDYYHNGSPAYLMERLTHL